MEKIKRSELEQTRGILNKLSGSQQILEATRTGIIRGLSQPIKVKRPNQYKNNK